MPTTGRRRPVELEKAGDEITPRVVKQENIAAGGTLALLCNVLGDAKMAATTKEMTKLPRASLLLRAKVIKYSSLWVSQEY